MKIKKLTITQDELNHAVQSYLKTKGVDLPVESVHKEYSYSSEYVVEFVEPVKYAPAQATPEPAETNATTTQEVA